MRIFSLFTLGVWASAAWAQPDQTPTTIANPPEAVPRVEPAPRPTEPKAQIEFDLRLLFRVLNDLGRPGFENDWRIGDYLAGGRLGFFGGQEWVGYFRRSRNSTQFRFDKIDIESLENSAARVKVFYALLSNEAPPQIAGEAPVEAKTTVAQKSETLSLKREIVPWTREEKWRIVPPENEKFQPYNALSLLQIAYFGGQRAGTLSQLRAGLSLQNLREIGLGAMQFAQDYDNRIVLENEFWREAIQPYVKSSTVFQIPGTRDFYTFNDQLSDRNMNEIRKPAQTVLFYEGENEKPKFRYGGKAAICFADGHVQLVSPDEADDLEWKP